MMSMHRSPDQFEEFAGDAATPAERRAQDAADIALSIRREIEEAALAGGDAGERAQALIDEYPADLQPAIRQHLTKIGFTGARSEGLPAYDARASEKPDWEREERAGTH